MYARPTRPVERGAVRPLLWLVLFALMFGTTPGAAQQRQAPPRRLAADEYLDRLPERFRAFKLGDASPRDLVRIVDRANGYAALAIPGSEAEPALELALFRAADGSALVGVTLKMAECDGTWYQTYFLTYDGRRWEDVTRASIPPEALRTLHATHPGAFERAVRFDLPRQGTTVVAQRIGDDGRPVEANAVLLQWAPDQRRFRMISRR